MSTDEINLWLTDGIAAAKAGKRAEARELLLRVVNADENNVRAWLWLSRVVTTLEDREVCLQNVLALDPANEAAQRGLARSARRDRGHAGDRTGIDAAARRGRSLRRKRRSRSISATPSWTIRCCACTARTGRAKTIGSARNCKRSLYSHLLRTREAALDLDGLDGQHRRSDLLVGGLLVLIGDSGERVVGGEVQRAKASTSVRCAVDVFRARRPDRAAAGAEPPS